MPAGQKPWLQRSRYWILWLVVVVVVIATALIAGKGSGRGGAQRPRVIFGANVSTPSVSAINDVNGWVASDGTDSVGVYAGSQKTAAHNGMFVIVRISGTREHNKALVTRGTGSLTLLRPAAPDSESAAAAATLHFITANGATGTLDLASDRVSING
jgi:hypothetical protein